MKITTAVLTAALSVSAGVRAQAQAANQIFGGYTSITFTSSFVASARESGNFISDLNGNPLPSSGNGAGELVDNLGTVSGVIDLDTGETNVSFRGGFLINYVGSTAVRVENLVLHAGKTGSDITGDFTKNGAFLGRMEIFVVNKNPNLVLPLKPVAGVLTLPNLSLGISPQFITQVAPVIGSQFTPATQIATASPTAVVSKLPATTASSQ